jgi:hypothetical protein
MVDRCDVTESAFAGWGVAVSQGSSGAARVHTVGINMRWSRWQKSVP